jgi:hypothetical protein
MIPVVTPTTRQSLTLQLSAINWAGDERTEVQSVTVQINNVALLLEYRQPVDVLISPDAP